MNTMYLNEAIARQRTADLGRRTRRAQRPVVDPQTTPRSGLVLIRGWRMRRSQVSPG
ncbi:hypothetical protein LJR027_000427 [Terrabacter sp. LjRoot27]|jgi:hypothetical protein|uniref:hypothetical protein n=1 Tax=Terrabacter sp. LjRoot27 TaxID=3342306 RepID=UPI003ED0E77A